MNNLQVALLWHFHQPMYSEPDNCTFPLPWVRLHCLKDYLDMLKHVQKFPEIRVTFNFTPSLLLQIQQYQKGECTDKQFLLFEKKADGLTIDDKTDILRDFFLAHWDTMIGKHPRYLSLLLKRGKNIVEEELASIAETFSEQEFLDLQIWANLVWIDPLFRHEIEDLYKKGKNFKEQDKERVIALEKKIISSIFDDYKKAWESGQIEITTSPMYHPILPLLINSSLAKESNPNLALPFQFVHPEDAVKQIEDGLALCEKIFGRKPTGLWPSEGSVCQELLPIASQLGIQWLATDEEILARSLKTTFRRDENGVCNRPEILYKPWKCENINIIFRDHMLSDLIGFVYNAWDQEQAAQDLTEKLAHLRSCLPTFDTFLIPIILDGENAWESYSNDGTEFLDEFYKNLVEKNIPTTTISQFLQENETKNKLKSLFPGSWIGANFNIWIGHAEDQKAWQIMKNVRDELTKRNITDKNIWERFYILEGSDWYWWFGEEHFSMIDETFDALFRFTAVWIYKQIGANPPPELFSSIKQAAELLTVQPNDKMTPEIDGKNTHFYEWYHAGHTDVKRMGGTMHRFAGLFSMIYCGFDDNNLYIRFDVENADAKEYEYTIKIYKKPKELSIMPGTTEGIVSTIDQIGEVAIPRAMLGLDKGEGKIRFIISAQQKGIEIDRTPLLKFTVKLEEVKLHNWQV